MTNLLCFPSLLLLVASTVSAFAANSPPTQPIKTILVTGANKGQGYALCDRILSEHDDTRVLLCSRDEERGQNAADQLKRELQERGIATCIGDNIDRVEVIPLDVTSDESVATATKCVQDILQSSPNNSQTLYGVVSNAGILWGYPLSELMDVCATGVRRVCDAFLPMLQKDDGRLIVVSSGLGPLMHGYSSEERQNAMMDPACTWDETIQPMIDECLDNHNCKDLNDKINTIISNKNFTNVSFDKKLNQWPALNNFKNSIQFNSWTYYAHDIDQNTLTHKRLIYKNKETNQ